MRVPKRSPGTEAGRGRARAPRTALQSASARRVNTRRPPNHPGDDRGLHTTPLPAVVNALKCGCMERPCATPPASGNHRAVRTGCILSNDVILGCRERVAGPHSSPSAAGHSSNPTSADGTLRQARRAACPAAAGRGDGRTRHGPAMRRGPALFLTCFRGRVLARHITLPCRGGATGGKVCRTSRCQCRRRLEECDGRPHRLHVLWRARSCSIRALLTQPRCRSGTAPHCFGRQGVSSVFRA